jgi:cytosine permease
MEHTVPDYISKSVPVPASARVPWYSSTFPTYFGIFLWVGFYLKIAEPTIGYASLGTVLLGLLVAGLLCLALYYWAPAMLGMQSGHPLYVVGTSTFGTSGGYLIPGLMMGFLQIGWVAAIGAVSANFIMTGLKLTSRTLYCALVIIWIYSLGWVAIKGIHHVARVAKFLNWIPLFMIVIVFWANHDGIPRYRPVHAQPFTGFLNTLSIVIGYFATAGAAGADFGMNNRDRKDILLGGWLGIVGGVLIAGGLPLLAVAGYVGRGIGPASYDYTAAIASVGSLAPVMFFLFAIASMVPTCFSSFIASNSFSTMLPKIPRIASTFIALTISVILAATGVANNLVGFFSLVAASFGPICGAMAADYLLAGRRWSGPRLGINWAGYIAWLIGFLVGIPEHIPGLPPLLLKADNPSGLYSFFVGFIIYLVLARVGLRPPVVETANNISQQPSF